MTTTYVYNPKNVSEDTLPRIFGYCTTIERDSVYGHALSEDGTFFAASASRSEEELEIDLGIAENGRVPTQKSFVRHHPDGFVCEYIPYEKVTTHLGLQAALAKASQKFSKSSDT